MGGRPFVDTPEVISWVYTPSNDGARAVVTMGPDFWFRSAGALGVTDVPPTVPPAMVAGVLAHVIERIAVGEVSADVPGPTTSAPSVGAIFDQAAAQGIATLLFQGTLPADAAYQPDQQLAIQQALESGRMSSPLRSWWISADGHTWVGGSWIPRPARPRMSGRTALAGRPSRPWSPRTWVSWSPAPLPRDTRCVNAGMQRYGGDERAIKLFVQLWEDILRLEGLL